MASFVHHHQWTQVTGAHQQFLIHQANFTNAGVNQKWQQKRGINNSLISPEEVGFPTRHPEKCSIDSVCGKASAQFLDVFGVARFQDGFIEDPMFVSCQDERQSDFLWRTKPDFKNSMRHWPLFRKRESIGGRKTGRCQNLQQNLSLSI